MKLEIYLTNEALEKNQHLKIIWRSHKTLRYINKNKAISSWIAMENQEILDILQECSLGFPIDFFSNSVDLSGFLWFSYNGVDLAGFYFTFSIPF